MYTKNLIIFICLGLFFGNALLAQDFKYIGAVKCKMCHNKPEKGEQYNKWKEGPHSKSMQTLSSEKALEYAKEHNIADPAKEPSCLKCHSTAGGTDASLHSTITVEEGVSCESCHGPGSVYKSLTIMKNQQKSLEKGLIIPNEEVCTKCHNEESPTFVSFDFEEYKAEIAHSAPE